MKNVDYIPLPTLSMSGWVRSLAEKVDRLLAYFFETDFYQTSLYKDKLTSIQYLIQEYGKDQYSLSTEIKRSLTVYLNRYFESSVVDVSIDTDSTTNKSTIKLYAKVTSKGEEYSIGKLLMISGTNITKIANLNN